MCLKNVSNLYLGDDGVKELVTICDHVHFSHKNKWTQDCFLSPKGAGPWQNPCDTDTGKERSVRRLAFFSVLHNHCDWLMPLLAGRKPRKIDLAVKNKRVIFSQCEIQVLCESTPSISILENITDRQNIWKKKLHPMCLRP